MSLLRLRIRLAQLEAHRRAIPEDHPRLFVVYEGEALPVDCRNQDQVIRVVYTDAACQEPHA